MSAVKLTKARQRTLEKAAQPGGVVGFGQRYKTVGPLRKMGLVEPNTENYGYMVITDLGPHRTRKRSNPNG